MFQFGHFVINQYLKLHLSIKHPQSYSVQGPNRIKVNQNLPVHQIHKIESKQIYWVRSNGLKIDSPLVFMEICLHTPIFQNI